MRGCDEFDRRRTPRFGVCSRETGRTRPDAVDSGVFPKGWRAAVICGMYSWLPVHEFEIKGHTVDVVHKDGKGIRAGINMKTGDIVVLAPPGISYHQAALEAVAALEAGKFHGREH